MNPLMFIFLCFVLGSVSAYYGQPYVHDNADALLIIITVFTVFAGFLVAIITILGDPAMMPKGSWRLIETRRTPEENRIIRHISLFVLYLVTIALLFVGSILKKVPDAVLSENWKVWIDRAYLFFGVSSFLMTFALPRSLHRMQMERLDREIEKRRKHYSDDDR